jgi:phosphoglucosamine mutase
VKKYKAKAGIMISASHNPFEYNGIKIFGEEGFKLSDELEEQIESIVLDNTPPCRLAAADEIGKRTDTPFALHDYISHLRETTHITLEGMKIAIDCANGAASSTARELFESLGAECHVLSESPNGTNINVECGSTNLRALKRYVTENGMDVGIAFDGDADRCLATDEMGSEVDGDYIMAILALKLKEEGELKHNAVVGTVMTNYGFSKFCEEHGIKYISAKVGDRYVLEMINQEGYSFGGEQSGHIILRRFATTGDGQLTALALLSHMKETGKKLSELCRVMKKYPQHTVNVKATQNEKIAFFTDEDIRSAISDAEERIKDRGRLVVRPSGTEPVIRVMAEGENEVETKELAEAIAKIIESKLKSY